jgi:mannose-6-phosphate isomerase-like protein (cupin superfamily)
MEKINILDKFSLIDTYWDPKIIGELNNQQVKLVKFRGEFDWHKHDNEDELFLVVNGTLDMQFRDKTITLYENDLIIVPRGVEHCPKAIEEVHVLLFEPVSTLNTGDAKSDKTVNNPDKI